MTEQFDDKVDPEAEKPTGAIVARCLRGDSFKEFSKQFLEESGHLSLCAKDIQDDEDFPEGFMTRDRVLEYFTDCGAADQFLVAINYMYDIFEGKEVGDWEERIPVQVAKGLAICLTLVRDILRRAGNVARTHAGKSDTLDTFESLYKSAKEAQERLEEASYYEVEYSGNASHYVDYHQGLPELFSEKLNIIFSELKSYKVTE
jgi:hypothetical protein